MCYHDVEFSCNRQNSCAVALNTTYEMSKLVKCLPKRGSLLEKLKQELAPETPGFRKLCPDETRRGVEIVVEDLHKSHVNSSNIYIILAEISHLKRLKLFWPKTHPKYIINAHRGTHKSKISRGRSPEPPLREREHPLVLSPLVPSALALSSAGPLSNTWRRA